MNTIVDTKFELFFAFYTCNPKMPQRIMYIKDLEMGKSYRVILDSRINRMCTCISSTGTRAIIVDTTGYHITLGLTDLIDTKVFRF